MGRGGRWNSHRTVINGILFRLRTGIPWRDFPARFGKWKTVHDRHRRWSADGTWEKILRAVQADADAEGRIDWSVVSVDPRCVELASMPPGLVTARRGYRDDVRALLSIAPMSRSVVHAAGSKRRFTWRVTAAAAHWYSWSRLVSGVTPRS